MGRPLSAGEIYRMNAARNVYDTRKSLNNVENRAEWAQKNPAASELMIYVEKLLHEDE